MPELPYKNTTAALLFSIFFGPLGLLYSSIRGGVVMIVVAFIVLSSHYPVPIILMWVGCSIWSVTAINRYNLQLMKARLENHEEKNSKALGSI